MNSALSHRVSHIRKACLGSVSERVSHPASREILPFRPSVRGDGPLIGKQPPLLALKAHRFGLARRGESSLPDPANAQARRAGTEHLPSAFGQLSGSEP